MIIFTYNLKQNNMASLIIVIVFLTYWTIASGGEIWKVLLFMDSNVPWYIVLLVWCWIIGMPILNFLI